MNKMTVELVMPVPELKPELIKDLLVTLGATYAGNVAIADSHYGRGARKYPLIKMKGDFYTWLWNNSSNRLSIKPYTKSEEDWPVEEAKVFVRGFHTGDTIVYRNEEDAKEYLMRLTSPDQLNLKIEAPNFSGSVMLYLVDELAKRKEGTDKK